jgi:hypothetical protein
MSGIANFRFGSFPNFLSQSEGCRNHTTLWGKLKCIWVNNQFLGVLVIMPISQDPAMPYDVEHEITLVQWYCAKVGVKQGDGTYKCTFGEIFNDEEAEQIFESLVSFERRVYTPFI